MWYINLVYFFSTKTMRITKIYFGHCVGKYDPSTELPRDFCAGIGLLQLGVVLVYMFFSLLFFPFWFSSWQLFFNRLWKCLKMLQRSKMGFTSTIWGALREVSTCERRNPTQLSRALLRRTTGASFRHPAWGGEIISFLKNNCHVC